MTAIGETDAPILRSGARRGDRIYVSRPLGGSAAGLYLLQHPPQNPSFTLRELIESAIRRHLDPEPEVALGLKLAGVATACIDISDGLAADVKDGERSVWITFGSTLEEHLTHGVHNVRAIRMGPPPAHAAAVLEIEAQDGDRTLLTVSRPEAFALPSGAHK